MTGADVGPTSWTRVATVSEFEGRRQMACRIGHQDLLLLRVGGEVIVLLNHCTHLGKPLTGGRVMGGQITCPFHGACFDVRTGAAVSGPAVLPAHRFPSRLEGDDIVANLSTGPASLSPGAAGVSTV